MTAFSFQFVPAGTVANPEAGKLYVDVGNHFTAGVIDHHHPSAPDACATRLALDHPEFIISQRVNDTAPVIITHNFPDFDAIGAVWVSQQYLLNKKLSTSVQMIADYICNIDRGHTTLEPENPVTLYSLMMIRLNLLYQAEGSVESKSQAGLAAGLFFLNAILQITSIERFDDLNSSHFIQKIPDIKQDVTAILDDLKQYQIDINRAELINAQLPDKNNNQAKTVPGLILAFPKSVLFKSWARGDTLNSQNPIGFVFIALQLSEARFIISVDPNSSVYLKGLGESLEQAEISKRQYENTMVSGKNRPGYNSPDPWYDGRSPLHNFSIIDSPRSGSLLTFKEVIGIFSSFCDRNYSQLMIDENPPT